MENGRLPKKGFQSKIESGRQNAVKSWKRRGDEMWKYFRKLNIRR